MTGADIWGKWRPYFCKCRLKLNIVTVLNRSMWCKVITVLFVKASEGIDV